MDVAAAAVVVARAFCWGGQRTLAVGGGGVGGRECKPCTRFALRAGGPWEEEEANWARIL